MVAKFVARGGCMRVDMRYTFRGSTMACVRSAFGACHLVATPSCPVLLVFGSSWKFEWSEGNESLGTKDRG